MARRPIFVPRPEGSPFVQEIHLTFEWFPGFAKSQAQRSIRSLHEAAAEQGLEPVLEISSKSFEELGVKLSAFNLTLRLADGRAVNVEAAFQGSKVFEGGTSYPDLYSATGREAKTDERIRNSGNLERFNFLGAEWPLVPRTGFYDWLYITALHQNPSLAKRILEYKAFSDIAFNPDKSLNCQARSAALYVALHSRGLIPGALASREGFIGIHRDNMRASDWGTGLNQGRQNTLF
ncbi:MAG: hypothetical protein M3R24_41210 [Chloroflexota bacterium]|nr:hypothetical protein [Chloroflexota bacterium]